MSKSLREMKEEVYKNNVLHGWFDKDRSFGDDTALLHSEISEAFDCYREIGFEPRTDSIKEADSVGKPSDVGSELADVLIRLLDTCKRTGYDLEWEYERKMDYNRTRPYRHGNRKV